MRYDSNGHVLWAQRAGSAYGDQSVDVIVNSQGYIFIAGVCGSSQMSFDSIHLPYVSIPNNFSQANVFIAKYQFDGRALQASRATGSADVSVGGFAVDAQGNACITGSMGKGFVKFGAHRIDNRTSSNISWAPTDMFIARILEDGQAHWALRFGDDNRQEGYGVAIDKDQNMYVTGYTEGSIALGYQSPHTVSDAFTVKLDPSGQIQWTLDGNALWMGALAVDPAGLVYVTGGYMHQLQLGGYLISGNGDYDAFVARINQQTTSVANEHAQSNALSVFPNPSTGRTAIRWQYPAALLSITNAAGQLVFQTALDAGQRELQPSLAHLPAGMYHIKVQGPGGAQTTRLVLAQ